MMSPSSYAVHPVVLRMMDRMTTARIHVGGVGTHGIGVFRPRQRHVRHTSFGCHGGVQQSESSRCSSHTFETVATFCEHTCDRLCLGMLWYWRHRVFRPRHRRRLCVNMYVSCVLPELLARRRGVDSVHYRIFCVFARLSRLV